MPTKQLKKPAEQVAVKPYAGDKKAWTYPERVALVQRLMDGDKAVLGEVQAMLDAHPESVRGWTDRVLNAGYILAREYFEETKRPIAYEMLPRRVTQIRAELEGEKATPLERLLCERVAACWLAVGLLDVTTIQASDGGPASSASQVHHDEMKSRAHRRYLGACVALAKVRRLLYPMVQQVNVAQPGANQLNIAAAGTAGNVPPTPPPPTVDGEWREDRE